MMEDPCNMRFDCFLRQRYGHTTLVERKKLKVRHCRKITEQVTNVGETAH